MAPGPAWSEQALEEVVRASFLGDINALKPGNVHRYAGGHGMRYEDFLASALVSVPVLCRREYPVGRRCLEAVRATRQAVGTNTNLGMLLLFAPLVCAAQQAGDPGALRQGFRDVVSAAQQADVAEIFTAIAEANPGGLGRVEAHDVHDPPDCTLFEAMAAAAGRDRIAHQFVTGGEDLFGVGLPVFERYSGGVNGVEWATVRCYLRLLASFPDSHVRRKHGPRVARQVSRRAEAALAELEQQSDPGTMTSRLLGLDREWKEAGINPGTSADLTAASLLLYHLGAASRA